MKYSALGILIKQEREKKGWEQSDLAAMVKVGQQAISGWEKGKSRPRQDDLLKLIDLFSVDTNDWLAIAGYEVEEPDTALVPFLPLHNLSAENFESFCRDLVQSLNPQADVHRYGSQGHKQEGIDIIEKEAQATKAYQCKRHKQFGPADIATAVKKTHFQADRYYFLLSRPATAQTRKAMLIHPNWSLWDREDLSAKVRSLPPVAAARIIDTYFPGSGWRKRFLGMDEPSPWFSPETFFLPLLNKLKLFTHAWSFVGRDKELKLLQAFENQEEVQAFVISGRGGIGKSRLLKAWTDSVSIKTSIHFLSPSADIKPQDIELLPKGLSYLIIDDAHDRSDLMAILSGISRLRPELKLILSTRPYGMTRLQDELTKSGITYDREKFIVLENLKEEDVLQLATEILSTVGGDMQYAQRIAVITKDCPLATVIGSRLVGEGKIKPELLNNEERFREELLRSFRNIVTGEIGGSEAGAFRDLLDLLALVQPLNPADPNFKEVAEKILKQRFDKTIRAISSLEEAGVVLRRGNRVRIVPDLLGDYIRASATFEEKSKTPTGYADEVFKVAKNGLATNLLVNISQLDWRLSADGIRSSLLDEVWTNLKDQFRKAKVFGRSEILSALKDVAYYQPAHALDFVHLALEEPTDKVEEELKDLVLTEPAYKDVLNKIPPILRYAAYHDDHLVEALDILKQLAEKDNRATNPYPDHPLRILQNLASLQPGKPVQYNTAVANHIIRWLQEDEVETFSPFDVLDELLKTEGHSSHTKGITLTLTPFKIRLEAVAELREKVIDAAFEMLMTQSISMAMRALKTIGESLHYPMDIEISQRKDWDKGILAVMQKLEQVVPDPKLDPFIAVEVRGIVGWHANYGSETTKAAAKKVLAAIPATEKYEISRAILDDWGWTFEKDDDEFGRSEAALIDWRKKLVQKLVTEYKDNFPLLVKVLEERVITLKKAKSSRYTDAGPFFGTLMESSPDLTTLFGEHLLSNASSVLTDWFGIVVSVMAKQNYSSALILIKKALEKNDVNITRRVARALGWGMSGVEVSTDEIDIIKDITHSTDEWGRRQLVRVVKRFPQDKKSIALDVLLGIDITGSKEVADEVLGEFDDRFGTFKIDDLSDKQLKLLLSNLTKCPSIDDHHIRLFLSKISYTYPALTLRLLTDRIEYKEAKDGLSEYHPLPYSMRNSEPFRFKETAQYEQLLRSVRDWFFVKTNNWVRFHYGPDLFKLISAGFDEVTLKVLDEWVTAANEQQLEAVAALVSEANNTFVWENEQFAVNLLEQSSKYGDKCYKHISSFLFSSVMQGGRNGTPGQPFPEDITQRDKSFEVMSRLPSGSPAHRFYKSLHEQAKVNIERDTIDDLDLGEE